MALNIREIGSETRLMEMEFTNGQMVENTRANGKEIKEVERVSILGHLEECIMANIPMMKSMGLDFMSGPTEEGMMDTGKTMKDMAKVSSPILLELPESAFGSAVTGKSGCQLM